MKELKKLAELCARRPDVLLQIYDGYACVYVGAGPERGSMVAKCTDDVAITGFIRELECGKYAEVTPAANYLAVA